ncbi:MFS transporter [Alicyclobacillus tolerans]|uniref:MFS transporter n=1 Tax=Alicyclobacillus tolerans TaxID=90970 RepID=UPI003B7CD576
MTKQVQWSPWRDKQFLFFASGNFIDNVGSSIYNVALPLFIYDVTKSLVAISFFVAMQPLSMLLAPIFGTLADRFGSRVLVIPGLTLQLLAALGINLVTINELGKVHEGSMLLSFLPLMLFVEIGGNAYRRGWMSGLPGMFGGNAVKARGSQFTLYVASTILGPLLVTVGLPTIGYLGLLWANLISYIAPMIVWWIGVHPPRVQKNGEFHFQFFQDLKEGWQIIRNKPQLVNYLIVLVPLTFSTVVDALVIYYLRHNWKLSARNVSTIYAIANIASFIGSLWASEQKKFRLRLFLAISVIGLLVVLLMLPIPFLPLVLFTVILNAFFTGAFGAMDGMLLVAYSPESAYGRISGIYLLLGGIPAFVSPLVTPLIKRGVGIQGTFLILAGVACLSAFWVVWKWSVWADTSVNTEESLDISL